MDAAHWKNLSRQLDQLLELGVAQRALRLEQIRREDPDAYEALQRLLASEHEVDDILATPLWSLPAESANAGMLFGSYRLLQLLGEGGMGEVWLAERADGLYQRRVALKLLRAGIADPELSARFSREREILARLEHPYLSRLLDAGIGDGGQPYLALTYVEGEPITDYCRRHCLSVPARLRLVLQVCAALSHAHTNLVVHRDLKPSNILVTASGDVCLLDFGIATLLDTEQSTGAQTAHETRSFTLHYAAPEQVRGEAITTLTDVYALGVVLYEVLTEQKPYRLKQRGDDEWEKAILRVQPIKASLAVEQAATAGVRDRCAAQQLARQLRGDLDAILIKTLQKQPADRYASVDALGQDLQWYLQDRPVMARVAWPFYRLRKYARRHRWSVAIGSTALVMLVATSMIAFWQAHQARIEMARAQAMQNFVVGLFDVASTTPHGNFDIKQLLAAGERRGREELAQQPLAHAELDGVIARLHIGQGDYAQALRLLEEQQQLLATQSEVPKGLQLEAVTQHGRALRLLGRSAECVALMTPTAGMVTKQESAMPQLAAGFYSQLGRCERMVGHAERAQYWLQRGLRLYRDVLDNRIGTVENLTDLAAMEGDAGRSDSAIEGYQRAMALLRKQPGGDQHPLMAGLQRSLAVAYRDLGDVAQAEQALRAAWVTAAHANGEQHPETLAIQRLLAAVLIDRGQLTQAEQELRSAHALTVQALGPNHRETGLSWNSLGILALEQGQLDVAIEDLARAVQVWRGGDSPRLLPYGLFNYARVLWQAGRQKEALAALQETRQLWAAQLGAESGAVADVDRQRAEILGEQGHLNEAANLLDQAITHARRDYGERHLRLQAMYLEQARNRGRMGQTQLALQQLERLAHSQSTGLESRKLRWLAQGYAAELRCHQSASTAKRALDGVLEEVQRAMPEGGLLTRQITALRAGCITDTLAARR